MRRFFMQETGKAFEHSFISKNRQGIKIDGVTDVTSFDTSHVQMNTSLGGMVIEGEELRVSVLDLERGVVEIEGNINGVFYFKEGAVKKGIFGRGK